MKTGHAPKGFTVHSAILKKTTEFVANATPRMTSAIYLEQQKSARYLQNIREVYVVVLQHDALLQYSPVAHSRTARNKPPKALAIVSQGAALAHCSWALAP